MVNSRSSIFPHDTQLEDDLVSPASLRWAQLSYMVCMINTVWLKIFSAAGRLTRMWQRTTAYSSHTLKQSYHRMRSATERLNMGVEPGLGVGPGVGGGAWGWGWSLGMGWGIFDFYFLNMCHSFGSQNDSMSQRISLILVTDVLRNQSRCFTIRKILECSSTPCILLNTNHSCTRPYVGSSYWAAGYIINSLIKMRVNLNSSPCINSFVQKSTEEPCPFPLVSILCVCELRVRKFKWWSQSL